MESCPPVVLQATETRNVTPDYADQQFQISIALPKSYANGDAANKKYPTIYLLDGNFYFGTVTEMTRVMAFCDSIPEVIVVGIGYSMDNSVDQLERSFQQLFGSRARDLTPVSDKEYEERLKERMSLDYAVSGHAPSFIQFMKEDLIPVVESNYRADGSHRILAGHSLGGLFVLYALFHNTSLFQGYVAASPSIWFGDEAILAIEEDYSQNEHDLLATLFLSVGEKEERRESGMVSDLVRLSALLESREYAGLTLKSRIFQDLNHCESVAPGLIFGIKAVLSMDKPENSE